MTRRVGLEIPAYQLQLQRTGSVISESRYAEGSRDVVDVVRQLIGDPDREHFVVVFLDAQFRFSGVQLVAMGAVNGLRIEAKDVFKGALACNAAALVLAHNHPSGDARPSAADEAVTAELEVAGCVLGIPVLDHIVLGNPGYTSLRESGRMLVEDSEEGFERVLVRAQVAARAKRALLAARKSAMRTTKRTGPPRTSRWAREPMISPELGTNG